MNKEIEELELEYVSMFSDEELFVYPPYWETINNDKLKIEVLKRAIKEKKYIVDVEGGRNFVEEVII